MYYFKIDAASSLLVLRPSLDYIMARKLSESDAESYRDKARRRKQRIKALKGELEELRETRKQVSDKSTFLMTYGIYLL